MDTEKSLWRKNSKYSENEQEMWDYILADSVNVTNLFHQMAEMQKKIDKLEQWYYQQYPDRLEKDLEFEKQFSDLKRSPKPDASGKKL
jgi:TolA-binding protein